MCGVRVSWSHTCSFPEVRSSVSRAVQTGPVPLFPSWLLPLRGLLSSLPGTHMSSCAKARGAAEGRLLLRCPSLTPVNVEPEPQSGAHLEAARTRSNVLTADALATPGCLLLHSPSAPGQGSRKAPRISHRLDGHHLHFVVRHVLFLPICPVLLLERTVTASETNGTFL